MQESTYRKIVESKPITPGELYGWLLDYVKSTGKSESDFQKLVAAVGGPQNIPNVFPNVVQMSVDYFEQKYHAILLFDKDGNFVRYLGLAE